MEHRKFKTDSADFTKLIFHHNPDLVFILDEDYQVLDLNRSAEDFFNIDKENNEKQSIFQFLHPAYYNLFKQMHLACQTDSTQANREEMEVVKAPSVRLPVEATLNRVSGDNNEVYLIFIARDISQYKKSDEQLKYRIEFEKMLNSISQKFINIPTEGVDDAIEESLKKIGEFAGIDNIYVYQIYDDPDYAYQTHRWWRNPSAHYRKNMPIIWMPDYPDSLGIIRRGGIIFIPSVEELNRDFKEEKALYTQQNVESVLFMPMNFQNQLIGFIGLDSEKKSKFWKIEDVSLLKTAGDIIVHAIRRKRTEIALKETEERYQSLFERSLDLIYIHDLSGYLVDMNQIALDLFGYKRENLPQLNVFSIVDKLHHQDLIRSINEVLLTGTHQKTYVFKIHIPNKGSRWVEIKSSLIYKEKEPYAMQGIARDITMRKFMEDNLRASESRYRAIFENSGVGIVQINFLGEILQANPAFQKMIGYHTLELLHQSLKNFIVKEDASLYEMKLKELLKEDSHTIQYIQFENRLIPKAGDKLWAKLSISVIRDPENNPEFLIAMVEDITLIKKAQIELTQSKERYQSLIENIDIGVTLIDMDYRIILTNSAQSHMFKRPKEEILGKACYQVFDRCDAPCENCPVSVALSTYQPVEMEAIKSLWDGTSFDARFLTFPNYSEDGNINGFVILMEDISERKAMERDLKEAIKKAEESNRLKSAFLANMSHEIRTPLNAIIGFVDLMRIHKEFPDKFKGILQNVKESGHLLLSLINDILDLSKIEADQLTFEKMPCSLLAMFSSLDSQIRAVLLKKGAKLEITQSYPGNIQDIILCDPNRLNQIMLNLISNAIKFTPKGKVEYGVILKDKETLEFYVKDTGIGIPEDKFDIIFLPFQQSDDSITRKYGGTGLGLAITKKLIHLMGGDIRLESKLGEGTTFYFTLPYHPASFYQKPEEISKEVMRSAKTKHSILIAEDDPMNQEVIREILNSMGFSTILAEDGQVALDFYKTKPDIIMILMDIRMPHLDGLSAIKAIRQYEKQKQKKPTPIIAFSAAVMEEDLEKGYEAGCDYYLKKPLDLDELIHIINKLL